MIDNTLIKELICYFESKEERTTKEQCFLDDLKIWQNAFPVTSVCRDDLESLGFDVSNVSDLQMSRLASKMGDDYCEQMFWSSMEILADGMDIPRV